MSEKRVPTERDAAAIVAVVIGEPARQVTRLLTGWGHYVYDVVTDRSTAVVVRVTGSDAAILADRMWCDLVGLTSEQRCVVDVYTQDLT